MAVERYTPGRRIEWLVNRPVPGCAAAGPRPRLVNRPVPGCAATGPQPRLVDRPVPGCAATGPQPRSRPISRRLRLTMTAAWSRGALGGSSSAVEPLRPRQRCWREARSERDDARHRRESPRSRDLTSSPVLRAPMQSTRQRTTFADATPAGDERPTPALRARAGAGAPRPRSAPVLVPVPRAPRRRRCRCRGPTPALRARTGAPRPRRTGRTPRTITRNQGVHADASRSTMDGTGRPGRTRGGACVPRSESWSRR